MVGREVVTTVEGWGAALGGGPEGEAVGRAGARSGLWAK